MASRPSAVQSRATIKAFTMGLLLSKSCQASTMPGNVCVEIARASMAHRASALRLAYDANARHADSCQRRYPSEESRALGVKLGVEVHELRGLEGPGGLALATAHTIAQLRLCAVSQVSNTEGCG